MRLVRFLALSILLHLSLLIGLLEIKAFSPLSPLSGGAEIRVDLASAGAESATEGELKQLGNPHPSQPSFAGKGGWVGSLQGTGSGPSGTDPVLAQILATIEANKHYPYLALKEGLSGGVQVRFLINEKGEPAEVTVLQSSGKKILDEEALATIRRGSYPRYGRPLPVWIRFELKERS